jgi:hypothetical protein
MTDCSFAPRPLYPSHRPDLIVPSSLEADIDNRNRVIVVVDNVGPLSIRRDGDETREITNGNRLPHSFARARVDHDDRVFLRAAVGI